jgi:hypothetical protein
MVSVGLYSRTIIPTIRSSNGNTAWSTTTTSTSFVVATGGGYQNFQVSDGETIFCSFSTNGNTYQRSVYYELRDDTGTVHKSGSKYNSGTVAGHLEFKNTTGATRTFDIYHKVQSGSTVMSYFTRFMIMNDSDLAKWERVNLPTTRYRKYAVDKYYLLAKWTSGSFNIDGYAVSTTSGGIVEVPVETIISSTALTGSGEHFFQVTGQGFTVTP